MSSPSGRPIGNCCEYAYGKSSGRKGRAHRCRKTARVIVSFELQGELVNTVSRTLRCWKHYMELENKLRDVHDMRILKATIISSKSASRDIRATGIQHRLR